jgi:alanine racemase
MRPGISLRAGELASVVGGVLAGVAPDELITLGPQRVAIHSAHVEPGGMFVALAGRRDGHDFVEAAIANKAACAIVAGTWEPTTPTMPLLRVEDPLAALQALAAWYRARLSAHVVAVVGSLGKTTTKDALVSFLGESSFCFGSPGSFNSQLGVPLAVLSCPGDAELAVFEAAATEPGEMSRLVDVVRPDTVVVTTVGDRFRRSFGSAGAYAAELCILARTAGQVVAAEDVGALARHLPADATLVTPSSASWPATAVRRAAGGTATITVDGHGIDVPTSSSWVAGDVALAAVTATLLGHPTTASSYAPTSVDLQTWRSPGGVSVLRSAAVDEPMAWRTALADAFDAASGEGRVVVVLSDAAHEMSTETLTALADGAADRPWSVLVTAGRAADVLATTTVPLRVFPSSAELSAALAREAVAGDVVSVITPRGELIEGISRDLFEAMAPIKLRIDVGAMALNVSAIRRQCPGAMVMAVVKAGAYGADAPELARHLAAVGVDQFAVSHADEGVALRRSGITAPVLVLLATPDELAKARRAHLAVCVHSPELLQAVLADPGGVVEVHVEVDSGLRRTGLAPTDAVAALAALRDAGVVVSGVMTHLSSADDPALDHLTTAQLATFDDVVAAIRAAGLPVPTRHALASSGVCRFPEHAMEMVRVGLALHGIAPSPACGERLALVPSLTLTSRLIDRRVLEPGDHVGYGATFRAPEPLVTGVVQLGYHDGIFRSFQQSGAVVIDGHRCPVVGRISMDSMVVDLSACPDVPVGADVVVFGAQGDSAQAIEDVAEAMGTIPYEVIARLGPRIQRVFVRH